MIRTEELGQVLKNSRRSFRFASGKLWFISGACRNQPGLQVNSYQSVQTDKLKDENGATRWCHERDDYFAQALVANQILEEDRAGSIALSPCLLRIKGGCSILDR